MVECKQTKKITCNCVQETQTLPMVHCGLRAIEVTILNVVTNNLQGHALRVNLPNSIIIITKIT